MKIMIIKPEVVTDQFVRPEWAELSAQESKQIVGGNGVWAGEDGTGCIPPFWPPFQIPIRDPQY